MGALRFTVGALQQILLKRTHAARIAFLTEDAAAAARSGGATSRSPGAPPVVAPVTLSGSQQAGLECTSSSAEPLNGRGFAGSSCWGLSSAGGSLVSRAPSGPALPFLAALQCQEGGDLMDNLPQVCQR